MSSQSHDMRNVTEWMLWSCLSRNNIFVRKLIYLHTINIKFKLMMIEFVAVYLC